MSVTTAPPPKQSKLQIKLCEGLKALTKAIAAELSHEEDVIWQLWFELDTSMDGAVDKEEATVLFRALDPNITNERIESWWLELSGSQKAQTVSTRGAHPATPEGKIGFAQLLRWWDESAGARSDMRVQLLGRMLETKMKKVMSIFSESTAEQRWKHMTERALEEAFGNYDRALRSLRIYKTTFKAKERAKQVALETLNDIYAELDGEMWCLWHLFAKHDVEGLAMLKQSEIRDVLKEYCEMGGNKSCTPLNVFDAAVEKAMGKKDRISPTQLLDWWRDWGVEFNVNMSLAPARLGAQRALSLVKSSPLHDRIHYAADLVKLEAVWNKLTETLTEVRDWKTDYTIRLIQATLREV